MVTGIMSRNSGPKNFLVPQPHLDRTSPAMQPVEERAWYNIAENSDAKEADVYIFDQIGGFSFWADTVSAKSIIDELKDLDVETINLHVNSPGGDVFEAVAIYNTLVQHKAQVKASVEGLAASAASFVIQAADEISMSVGSMMMIHDARALAYDNPAGMQKIVDLLNKVSDNIANVYALRAGENAAYWRAFMTEETWYTAQEAVDANLADKVSGKSKATVDNNWFKAFNYAGRNAAPSPNEVKSHVVNSLRGNAVTQPQNNKKDEAKTEQTAGFQGLVVNGNLVTDVVAVQDHITNLEKKNKVLEEARAQQTVLNRKAFVEQLAKDGKITASQIGTAEQPGLEAFALSLPDASYEAWTKTWDVAPKSSLLATHGKQTEPGPNGAAPLDQAQGAQQEDPLDIDREIIAQHKRGGMSDERVKETESYKRLAAAGKADGLL